MNKLVVLGEIYRLKRKNGPLLAVPKKTAPDRWGLGPFESLRRAFQPIRRGSTGRFEQVFRPELYGVRPILHRLPVPFCVILGPPALAW